jgi:hypothetical protein
MRQFMSTRASVFASAERDVGLLELLQQYLYGTLPAGGQGGGGGQTLPMMLGLLVAGSPRALHAVSAGVPLPEAVAQAEQRLLDIQRTEFFHVDPEEVIAPPFCLQSRHWG